MGMWRKYMIKIFLLNNGMMLIGDLQNDNFVDVAAIFGFYDGRVSIFPVAYPINRELKTFEILKLDIMMEIIPEKFILDVYSDMILRIRANQTISWAVVH
jgi:hypothetical protein